MKFNPSYLLLSTLLIFVFFSYAQKEKEVSISNSNGKVYGTLTLPKGKKSDIPVALFIAGSGPTDRNGNNPFMKNNSLKMLSDSLVKLGVATLRYDKQGIGASASASKPEIELTVEDFILDVKLWIEFLRSNKKLGGITLIGHSEGSFFALAAAQDKPVKQVVSLAGAGRRIDEVILEQLGAQDENLAADAKIIFDSLKVSLLVNQVNPNLMSLFRKSIQPYIISWMKYDPAKLVSTLSCPVFVIQGDQDIQVQIQDARLLVGQNRHAQLHMIEGMNHIFKKVEGDRDANMMTYIDPNIPIMTELVDVFRSTVFK